MQKQNRQLRVKCWGMGVESPNEGLKGARGASAASAVTTSSFLFGIVAVWIA